MVLTRSTISAARLLHRTLFYILRSPLRRMLSFLVLCRRHSQWNQVLRRQVGRQLAAADQCDGQPLPHRRRPPDEIRGRLSPDHLEDRTLSRISRRPFSSPCQTFWRTPCRQAYVDLQKRRCAARLHQLSIFAQDTWKATRTLTITYGLRWEYNARALLAEWHSSVHRKPGEQLRDHDAGAAGHAAMASAKRRFRPPARRRVAGAPESGLPGRRRNLLRPGILRRGGRRRRWPYAQQKIILQLAISAERRQCRSAALFHDAAGRVSRSRRPESRIAQNL